MAANDTAVFHVRIGSYMREVSRKTKVKSVPKRTYALWTVVVACVGVLMMSTVVIAGVPARKLSPLQKGLNFYSGKTLSFITGSVGGGNDVAARALAPLMASYLHATINVVNEGNQIGGEDTLAAASPTGLTIGYVNTGAITEDELTKTPGFNFNPTRLSWIAGTVNTPTVLIANPTSAYTSFTAFKTSPPKVLIESASQGAASLQILLGLLGVHVQFVTGYSSTSQLASGFVRGDGPIANLAYTNTESFLSSGVALPIAITKTPPVGALDRKYVVNTPTYADLLNQYLPVKDRSGKVKIAIQSLETYAPMGMPLVTQTKVSDDEVLALRAAAAWAYKQPNYVNTTITTGGFYKYINPVLAKAQYVAMIKSSSTIACYLPGAC